MAGGSSKKAGKKKGKRARKAGGQGEAPRAEEASVPFSVPPAARTETVEQLRARARRLGLTGYYRLRKADLLQRLQEGEHVPRD